jgi:hypothetical protein
MNSEQLSSGLLMSTQLANASGMRLVLALLSTAAVACGGAAGAPGSGTSDDRIPLSAAPDDGGAAMSTTENPGGTIEFAPTTIYATRYSNLCGIMNPPFMDGDLYSLDVIGNQRTAPYNALTVTFNSPATVGTPLAPAVQPLLNEANGMEQADGSTTWHAQQTAQSSAVAFGYSQGSDPSEIDPGAFDAVTITILAMPSQNGAPLTVRIEIHFADGKTLDETFSSPLSTSWSGCPAG